MEDLKLLSLKDVEEKEVEWLWKPYLPKGKLCVVHGDPGCGKTTLLVKLCALLTKGSPLPFDEKEELLQPMNVIYQTAEDGYDDTIKPRFKQENGDESRFYFINDKIKILTLSDKRIEESIKRVNAGIMILDPVQAYMGSGINSNNINEVRPVLKKLLDVAERTGCTIVLVGHNNKNEGTTLASRLNGSIDFLAAVRSSIAIRINPEDAEKRDVIQTKSSLAPKGYIFNFLLKRDTGFEWGELDNRTYDDLFQAPKDDTYRKKKEIAMAAIKALLSDGQKESALLKSLVTENFQIGDRIYEEAKKELNVQCYKKGKTWYSELN